MPTSARDARTSQMGTRAPSVLPRAAAPLAAALLLAACASGPPPETAGFGCPRVGIVRDAASATTFRPGPGRDATDVQARAEILDYRGNCSYDRDGSLDVELDVAIGAERGPALAGERLPVDYFVAIVDGAQNVLAREAFRVDIDFAGQRAASAVDQLGQRIPLPRGVDGRNYEILVGFVLSADQLAWNRRDRPDAAPPASPTAPAPIGVIPTAPRQR